MPPTSGTSSEVYAAYGFGLASSHDFPELHLTDRAADYQVRWNSRLTLRPGARWSVLWRFPSGEPWALVARADGLLCFRFPRYLTVCASGDSLDVARRGHAADDTIRHLLLDQVLPLILAAQGHLVLHASAVLIDGHAVLLAGETGTGKSTLAAQLSLAGATVLADDGVLLREGTDGLEAVPSYAGLRLFDDSALAAGYAGAQARPLAEYTTKRRYLPPGEPASRDGAYRLGPLYFLDAATDGGEPVFSPLSRRDTTIALLGHAYRVDLAGHDALRDQFDRLAGWSGRLSAWQAHVPRRLDLAAPVAEALAAHARREIRGTTSTAGL